MRISCFTLLSVLATSTVCSPSVGADEIRDANRLLRASNVSSHFETRTQLQTRKIIRTYSSIVAMSADIELPQWIKTDIADCYRQTFAWEKFEDGIAEILLANFSSKEMRLLTDFYRSQGLPPTEIENFKTAIAKSEQIAQQSTDYIFAQTDGCADHDIELILSFLQNPEQAPRAVLAAE